MKRPDESTVDLFNFGTRRKGAGSEGSSIGYLGCSNAVPGLFHYRDRPGAALDRRFPQEPFERTKEARRALDLESKNNNTLMSARREAANVREIQIASENYSPFLLSGFVESCVRSAGLKAIERMNYIVAFVMEKLLGFKG